MCPVLHIVLIYDTHCQTVILISRIFGLASQSLQYIFFVTYYIIFILYLIYYIKLIKLIKPIKPIKCNLLYSHSIFKTNVYSFYLAIYIRDPYVYTRRP